MKIAPQTMDDLRKLIATMPSAHAAKGEEARARQDQLVKPAGSLGRLEEIAIHLARWQGRKQPRLDNITITIFAGAHGITRHGVSAFPEEVNAQMLAGFRYGFAAICQLAECFGAALEVVDCGVANPTADFTVAEAMDEIDFMSAVRRGTDAVRGDEHLIVLGEMGIGNTTAAAAVSAALFGGDSDGWVGRGTGVDDEGLRRKAEVVARGLRCHDGLLGDPLEVLRRFGGREMAAMFGAALAARHHRIPVLLDGFIVTASLAPLAMLADGGLDHVIASHCSQEHGHGTLLQRLGLKPLLHLDLRLGEGSGAATALGIVKAALACHNGMATFAEAAVSAKSR